MRKIIQEDRESLKCVRERERAIKRERMAKDSKERGEEIKLLSFLN